MVLPLKRWKSRSSPGIEAGGNGKPIHLSVPARKGGAALKGPRGPFCVFGDLFSEITALIGQLVTRGGAARQPICTANRLLKKLPGCRGPFYGDAGWSSPVARQAHNLKVVGSNPTPATNTRPRFGGVFCVWRSRGAGALLSRMTAHPDQIYDIAVIG